MVNVTISSNPFTFETSYKEPEYDFEIDPLVLACSLKDLVDKGLGYRDLESGEVIENITDSIRTRAEEIRKYYGKKFVWQRLNGGQLSGFRDRTLYLLENRVKSKLKEKDKGLYFKLPFFYDEDMIYEDFKKKYNTSNLSPLGNKRSNVFAKKLTYIRYSIGTQSKRKIKYFWFHDDNNDLYSIHVNMDNELLTMFESFLLSKNEHIFETRLNESRIDNMHFYKLYSFKFLRINE